MAYQSRTKRLITCLCGCRKFTEEEVKNIYHMTVEATLKDRIGNHLLRTFLEMEQSGDKGKAQTYLDVHDKCSEFLQQKDLIFTLDKLDELSACGLRHHLKWELKIQNETGDRSKIVRYLENIKVECCNEIEASRDYKNYKQAILDKLC